MCRAEAGECQDVWTATSPCPQITLDLENSSISTKGTKSGAFVMYNCARLATLFDTYQRAVEQGERQPLHPPLSPSMLLSAAPGLFLMPGATGASLATTTACHLLPGTYPPLPPPSELDFSCLREEVSAEQGSAGTCVPSALVMGAAGLRGSAPLWHK